MRYRIFLEKVAEKQLDKLGSVERNRIINYLEGISDSPESHGKCLKHSFKGIRRYRVGKYRILTITKNHELQILVIKIAHRSLAYS